MNDKRFEALLKQEMTEHKAVISSHHKEMQDLRDALKMAMERFNALYERSEQEFKDMALHYNQQILFLTEKVKANEIFISDQKQTILSLYQQLHDFQLTYCSQIDKENLKKEMNSQIKEANGNYSTSFQNLQQELKSLYRGLKEEVNNLQMHMNDRFNDSHEYMANKLSVSKLEKEAVLNEIRVYDKSQFIIEKKIENIYTLIERLNKRGETCPKQES
jgi:phage host-nuclease inhibitor protein Gam